MGNLKFAFEFALETCIHCGICFAIPLNFQIKLKENHATFNCPNGHGQHYTGVNKEEKLRKELKRVHEQKDEAVRCCSALEVTADKLERSVRGYQGKIGQMKRGGIKTLKLLCVGCGETTTITGDRTHEIIETVKRSDWIERDKDQGDLCPVCAEKEPKE